MPERENHVSYFQDEDLPCLCWCGRHFVLVTRSMIKRGLTFPCKLKKCVVIAEQNGWKPVVTEDLSPQQMERCYA